MRRQPVREEPLTINGKVVAEFLRTFGCPQMADFVRHMDERLTTANQREIDLQRHAAQLAKRLAEHEPPTPETGYVSYRSEWD